MNGPARTPSFLRTPAGKQLIAQLIITVGVVGNLAGIFLQANPRVDPSLVHGLNGFGLGMILVGGVALISIRRKQR
jgi:hypothetical protein